VKRRRRLRRLVPDAELLRRRLAGEPLRELAHGYGVAHTTLGRYFDRPDVKAQLRQVRQQLRAEQRALAGARAAERRLKQEVRRKAAEQVAREREQERQFRADWAEYRSRRPVPYSDEDAWRDERNAPGPAWTRADLHSRDDVTAARVVDAGGGLQAVIEATELRTLKNVADLDPVILTRAYDNDRRERTRPPVTVNWQRRPRRLTPDPQLLRRRAAGEPLRTLARDYSVAHSTLSRFFARPEISKQLRHTLKQLRAEQRQARPTHRPRNRTDFSSPPVSA
jgi:hypothetical protein